MKKNCIVIPINKPFKIYQSYNQNAIKPASQKTSNNHISFDMNSNFYQQNDYVSINKKNIKNSNDFIILKKNEFNPSLNAQDYKKENYEMKTYKTQRYSESELNKDNINSSSYKPYFNNDKIFNGNQNKFVNSKNSGVIDITDKNKANYTYYESKYSRKDNYEQDNYSFKNKYSNKNVLYSNENHDTSNLTSNQKFTKNRRIDSNFSIKSEYENSNIKNKNKITDTNYSKSKNEKIKTIPNTTDKKRIISIKEQNITKSNQRINRNINDYKNKIPNSSSTIYFDNSKDIYRSPVKKIIIEKNFYGNETSGYKAGKSLVSKSSDKIRINNRRENSFSKKDENIPKNKKIEMIKAQKSNIIDLKKHSNLALKKIPISPKNKKNSNNSLIDRMKIQKKNLNLYTSNTKDDDNKKKANYSFTSSKPNESRTIQYGYNERNEKPKNSLIKELKFTDSKNFQKCISSEIEKIPTIPSYRNYEREKDRIINISNTKLNTIHIGSISSNEDNNYKRVNISYNNNHNQSDFDDDKRTFSQKKNLILNRLKKGRSNIINIDKNDDKFIRRLYSQQNLIIYKDIPEGKLINESSKINTNNKINVSNPRIKDQNQKYSNDKRTNRNNILNKLSKKNYSNTHLPLVNNNLYKKFNNYTNTNEIKKDNSIHTITINKINSSSLENNHQTIVNNKNNNSKSSKINKLQNQKNKRCLSNFPKRQSRINIQESKNNNNQSDEEDWEDNEYMGIRKKTYDPMRRKMKKKQKNEINNLKKNNNISSEFFSYPTFIKSCESITVPGKKENGNKKINQDSYIIERNINGILNFNIFGVLDGHGEDGHYASQFVSRYIITHIKNNPLIKKSEDAKEIYQKLISNGYEIIANLFTDADVQIQKEKFDCKNSGTTCVIVIQLEEKIICANAGDSRAIMIFDKTNNDHLINSKIYPLSYDCKPELPKERMRIYECGGSVERALDENEEEGGPYRVWAFGEDYPGLAMSRSIGDMDAKKIGVIPNPQIVEYNIDYDTKYMLICSDGVWEFINSEEAMKIGNKFYLRNDANGLCQELYKKSVEFWLKEDIVVDDITAIAVFF